MTNKNCSIQWLTQSDALIFVCCVKWLVMLIGISITSFTYLSFFFFFVLWEHFRSILLVAIPYQELVTMACIKIPEFTNLTKNDTFSWLLFPRSGQPFSTLCFFDFLVFFMWVHTASFLCLSVYVSLSLLCARVCLFSCVGMHMCVHVQVCIHVCGGLKFMLGVLLDCSLL